MKFCIGCGANISTLEIDAKSCEKCSFLERREPDVNLRTYCGRCSADISSYHKNAKWCKKCRSELATIRVRNFRQDKPASYRKQEQAKNNQRMRSITQIRKELIAAQQERDAAKAENERLQALLLEAFKQSDACLDFYYEQSTFHEDFYQWKQELDMSARQQKTELTDRLQPLLGWLTARQKHQKESEAQND